MDERGNPKSLISWDNLLNLKNKAQPSYIKEKRLITNGKFARFSILSKKTLQKSDKKIDKEPQLNMFKVSRILQLHCRQPSKKHCPKQFYNPKIVL